MVNWLTDQCRSLSDFFRKGKNKYNDDYLALADAHQEWVAARNFLSRCRTPISWTTPSFP